MIFTSFDHLSAYLQKNEKAQTDHLIVIWITNVWNGYFILFYFILFYFFFSNSSLDIFLIQLSAPFPSLTIEEYDLLKKN